MFLPLLLASQVLIFLGRQAGCAMKLPREAGLRGELRIERYLRERQFARCQFCHRLLQPHAAYIAVRWNAHGKCELAREMKCTVTRYSSETYQRDIVPNVGRDIVENAAQSNMIETMRIGLGGRACPAIAIFAKKSGRER